MNKSMITGHIILKFKAIYLSLKFIRYSNGTECLPKVNHISIRHSEVSSEFLLPHTAY